MTDRKAGASATGTGVRALFAERFALLYVTAGDPPLKRVADAVERARRLDERGRPIRSTAQRISDWRRGRNVPARFAALSVVLEILIGEARKHQPQPPVEGLYDLSAWRARWEEALTSPLSAPDPAPAAEESDAAETPPVDGGLCPYRGLAAFGQEESGWFFGRERATTTLVERLAAAADEGGITMLVGASGAGKSSLLGAGLLPALTGGALAEQGSSTWPVRTTTPGEDPLRALTELIPELNEVLATADRRGAAPGAADRCAEDVEDPGSEDRDAEAEFRFAESVRDAVAAHVRRAAGDEARLVLVVDQFEEAFTMCRDERARALFVQVLNACCTTGFAGGTPPGLVVLGLRADFYARCLDFPELAEALQHRQMVLGAMTVAELRKAITGPAKATGLQIEPGLVDVLLRDLGVSVGRAYGKPSQRAYDAGALPLLSHALMVTWQRRQSGKLTIAGYRAAGGIQGAVAATAERAWAELAEGGQAAARQVLLRLVHVGEDTQDTRRRATYTEIVEHAEHRDAAARALNVLTTARLVTLDADSAEISHEALLYAWPRLRSWIDQDRAGNLARQRLERDAESWRQEDRDPSLLYRGARLETAQHWADQVGSAELAPISHEFLHASMRHRRRAGWFRRGTAAAVCVFAAVAAVAAVLAVRERDDAEFRQVLAQADRLQAGDPSAAAKLNLVAERLRPDDEGVYTRLLSTQNSPLSMPVRGHEGPVYLTTFSPDGRTLATASYDETVRLWDVSDRMHPKQLGKPLTGFGSWVTSAVFSPDGRTLAAAGDDHLVRLYDVSDPARPESLGPPIGGTDGTIYLLAFSPDGRTLATANEDRTARLWNVTDPARPVPWGDPLTGHFAQVRTLAFTPDGRTLATSGDDRTVRLWNVADPARPTPLGQPLTGHTGGMHTVAFSPDGRTLASGSSDKTIRLWDVHDPARAEQLGPALIGHNAPVWSVKFSPDGRTLASGSADSSALLWNVTDPANATRLGQSLSSGSSTVFAVGFSPDGATLATGADDGTVRLWSLPERILSGHTARVNTALFSPDGRTLITAGDDHTMRVWDVSTRVPRQVAGPLEVYDGPVGSVYAAAFRPDGRILATGGGSGTVRLWDMRDRSAPKPLGRSFKVNTRYAGEVEFSPDGRTLVTCDDDHSVQLWNVADPENPVRVGGPLTGHRGYINEANFSPDGRLLATASSDGTVRMWDVSDRAHAKLVGKPLDTGDTETYTASFSPDGNTIATAGQDKAVRLWDVSDPAAPRLRANPLIGHTQIVKTAVFSPDGETLATAGEDRTVRLWDVSDPQRPSPIGNSVAEHQAAVNTVSFSPDGRTFATSSGDNTAQLWDLDEQYAIDRICATTRGVLPRAQWEQTIPQTPYSPPCT
ncbi:MULTISPECIES: AAA family ATPase [unclassified Saccharopolyspora]|uniref:nSTAND1 domain-containing NTPase n=1 Tax=unclassified Saccharopolyspora TaxID=2646250 RepID=UPI001CD67487|nr:MULTISPECIES: AAA family ATPase [unclassified Saccharopolyspora]MCA1191601.1 AAA family ATPase [Saccharopolyspora sp. 6V]MCA1227423.1 AAA family ATPase [Saccharopolyspora sp. 6M]